MSDPLFKCDVWHMNTTPDDKLGNMERRTVEVRVMSSTDDPSHPQNPIESPRIVVIPMLCNTRDVKAGDRLFCKSTIGVPCNRDTGDASRATLGVSSEYAVPISQTAAAHRRNELFPEGGKRRRVE